MHELSIVLSIVDTAEEQARKHHAKAIEHIDLEIGNLAGVDEHALHFAWEVGVKDTILEKANYSIHKIKACAKCTNCDCEFEMKERFDPCPLCGEHLVQLLNGREMKIKSITLLN
jgi:hydrogenase nickel incorporation protein HypA/HybF